VRARDRNPPLSKVMPPAGVNSDGAKDEVSIPRAARLIEEQEVHARMVGRSHCRMIDPSSTMTADLT